MNMSLCDNTEMAFHFGYNEVVLFHAIRTSNTFEMTLVAVICFFIAFIYESLKLGEKSFKTRLRHSYRAVGDEVTEDATDAGIHVKRFYLEKITRRHHLILSIIYFIQTINSYALMMIFMTFNLWLCGAVILGHVIGFSMYQRLDI